MRKPEPKIAGMETIAVELAARAAVAKMRSYESWMADQGVTPNSPDGPRASSFAIDDPAQHARNLAPPR